MISNHISLPIIYRVLIGLWIHPLGARTRPDQFVQQFRVQTSACVCARECVCARVCASDRQSQWFLFFFKGSVCATAKMNICVGNIFSILSLGWMYFLQSANAQACLNWCASEPAQWETKCKWRKTCGGCSECISGGMISVLQK